ncbi:Plasmid stabilization system protein [Bacteroidales bacterium Barb7]|nr:Plasmid stabilization system protein [Bacteroidales bacterium Barb7]
MSRYIIVISDKAMNDIDKIVDYICDELKVPFTARRYHDGLINTIRELSTYAGSIGISQSSYIQSLCGPNARRINFKKQAIIYTIEGDSVYIRRIIASALIH